MSFDRQLDVLVAFLTALIVFVGCVFNEIPVKISLLISVGAFSAGIFFGRGIAQGIAEFFSG